MDKKLSINAVVLGVGLFWFSTPAFSVEAQQSVDKAGGEEVGFSCASKVEHLIGPVDVRSKQLDEREDRVRSEEERLKVLFAELDESIAAFAESRDRLESILNKVNSVSTENMGGLSKLYENMPPEEAASRLEKVGLELAVKLLKVMNSRKAGKIMAYVEPSVAADFTREFDERFIPEVGL